MTSVGAVVLTMGARPVEFTRGLASLLEQRDVDLDVVVVGNGWQPTGLPEGVRTVALPENLGIPEGRNRGAARITADIVFFFDDDAYLPDDRVIARMVEVFESDSRIAVVQPRAVDPDGAPSPRRWVPRLRTGDASRSSAATVAWEGVLAVRRDAFEQVRGWPGHFFYAHEGIDLMWRIWDLGLVGWYAADILVHHPATSPTRHQVYYRMNARNRVWLAMRNLPALLVVPYLLAWVLITLARFRSAEARRAWFGGFREGLRGGWGARRPMSWRTVLRLTAAGRPPLI